MAGKKTASAPVKPGASKDSAVVTKETKPGPKAKGPAGAPKQAKPSAKALAESARERLVGALDGLRRLGASSYPPTVDRWLQVAEVAPLEKKLLDPRIRLTGALPDTKKAAATSSAARSEPIALLAFFAEDEALAVDALLKPLLLAARTSECNLIAPGELGKGLEKGLLEKGFKAAIEKRAAAGPQLDGPWPDGIGTLLRDGECWLFLLDDVTPRIRMTARAVSASPASPTSPLLPSSPGFAARFEEAFARLDRAAGNANYVLLSDLRRALADVERKAFDDGLNALRRAERFTLDSADGRHQRLPQDALDAGMREGSNLLVYAARR